MSRNAITRLLGRLEIHHGEGVIEFRIRNPREINKRGVVTVVRIEGLGDIPLIMDGVSVHVEVNSDARAYVSFEKEQYAPFSSHRRNSSEGAM